MVARRVRIERLDVALLEAGPADGPPVLLLHGFPDDATAWTAVMQRLAAEGRRCVAPYVRGCGGSDGSRFLEAATPCAGDFPALGNDVLALVDALDLGAAGDLTVVGKDWGSPTAEIVAMERPDRVARLVKCNWYGVYSMHEMAHAQGFAYAQLRALWYVWLLNLPLGELVLQYDRVGFARALWEEWSPSWSAGARGTALDAVCASFDGEDWARVALSAYRANSTPNETDPADDALRERLKTPQPVRCETRIVHGADDGVERSPLSDDAQARWFAGGVRVTPLAGVGHWPQREAPDAVAAAVLGMSRRAAREASAVPTIEMLRDPDRFVCVEALRHSDIVTAIRPHLRRRSPVIAAYWALNALAVRAGAAVRSHVAPGDEEKRPARVR